MTNDKLREVANFYKEKEETATLLDFIRNSSVLHLSSGTRMACIPSGLQYRIRTIVAEYYEELKKEQEEL